MGIYLNPGNKGFKGILNGTYVDKTGLIDYVNSTINTSPDRLTCFSRPRRFGKSFAAKMLCAYYDKSCDSRALFEGLEISRKESFEKYLNQFDVIYLDITRFISTAEDIKNVVRDIQKKVIEELRQAYPDCVKEGETVLADALAAVSQRTDNEFVVIIDEWDALFREAKNDSGLQKEYVQLLRGLFKGGTVTDETIAAAYITGILPIKRYGTESALTDFQEFTMTKPDILASYVGFTEDEVCRLCEERNISFEKMKRWYDGYSFETIASVYSPNSVMSAIRRRSFRSYWTTSETYESLKDYISMNFDGLKDAIVAALAGQRIGIETLSFQNDLTSFKSRDDVLTLLIHLGYFAYDEPRNQAYIPNLEVAESFKVAVQNTDWRGVNRALRASEDLLNAAISFNSQAVAAALDEVHSSETSILQYNDENSLSCAITIAFYTARNYYTIIRELPTGKGFADLAFLPRKGIDKPAMIVELKYDKTADTAIQQIKDRRYQGALKDYGGELLLVGINYDKADENKRHTCLIEKWGYYSEGEESADDE
ncbi:MAG: ATP-binding protein [Lachnospiraceae bacterium]|nr:ATP-binding protein [Lachnospiraceae bacterium]